MESAFLNYITVTNLPIIETVGGSVLKGLLKTDSTFNGFGEAYFSEVEPGAIKGWKYHKEMTLNLIVPKGQVKFVFCIQEEDTDKFEEIVIGKEMYARITVKPGIWFGFQGVHSETSLVLNIADILHRAEEVDRLGLNDIKYNW
jgi:dTDP-4-dehydrorhamnose 3,5-epimerase